MRFTDRTLAALTPPESGQKIYSDDNLPGFGLRVGIQSKTFVLTVGENRKRITIGRYIPGKFGLAQARDKARTILAERQLGLDKPITVLFKDIEEEYRAFREQMLRPGTVRKDPNHFRIFSPLAKRQIAEIDPGEVQRLLDKVSALSTRQEVHNRFVGLIRFAQKRGYTENWPIHRLEYPAGSFTRDRVLADIELRKILDIARMWRLSGHAFGDIVELLILTGQRRHQIAFLHGSHINYEENTITWPAGLMKMGRKHTIPLSPMVRTILEPRKTAGLYFPNRYGEPFSFSTTTLALFKRDCEFCDWRLHDLRRSLATGWQRMGIDIATTEKMLSHSAVTGGLVGIYQRADYLEHRRIG